jgi:hypothetical protein
MTCRTAKVSPFATLAMVPLDDGSWMNEAREAGETFPGDPEAPKTDWPAILAGLALLGFLALAFYSEVVQPIIDAINGRQYLK